MTTSELISIIGSNGLDSELVHNHIIQRDIKSVFTFVSVEHFSGVEQSVIWSLMLVDFIGLHNQAEGRFPMRSDFLGRNLVPTLDDKCTLTCFLLEKQHEWVFMWSQLV